MGCQSVLRVLGGQVPRLYGGTIFGGVRHPRGVWQGFRVQRLRFSKSLSNFFDPPNVGILTHKLAQMCNYMRSGIPFFFFFFYGSGLRAMAIRKICRFWVDRRIVDLHHEGSTIFDAMSFGNL